MNPRIKELLDQCTHDILGVKQADHTEFAQLIVQECIFISRTSTDGFSAGRRMAERFGVES